MATRTITGKTVVVTGGTKGIGLGLVRKFLDRGNTVIATGRNTAQAAEVQQLLKQQQGGSAAGRLLLTDLDTARPESVQQWAQHLKASTQHVDVLVNNAGVYGRRLGLEELEASDFLYTFTTNTVGPFLVVQQLVKQGLLGPPGSLVVNISSIMSSQGDTTVSAGTKGGYAYRASKAGLNIINKALALDLQDRGVQCVCMHPGYVRTDLTGGQGWLDVEESSSGILSVLESGKPLNDKFYAYSGEEIPW